MIGESVNFMITGMTVVFMFLVIMVLVLEAQGKLINYITASSDEEDSKLASLPSNVNNDEKKVAVISAAVKQHIKEKE